MGITHRTGNIMGEKTIRDMIANPKYIGTQFYSRYSKNPVIVPDAHPAIISKEDFEEANRLIKVRKPSNDPNAPMRNPLSTILRCSTCDTAMVIKRSVVKGKEYIYYYCRNSWCDTVGTSMDLVVDELLKHLKQELAQVDVEYEPEEKSQLPSIKQQLEKAQKKLKTIEKRRDNIHDFLEDGTYTKEKFMDRMEKLDEEEQQTFALIDELNQRLSFEQERDNNQNQIIPAISNALEVFEMADARQKNILLKSFIHKIMYIRKTRQEDFRLKVIYIQ